MEKIEASMGKDFLLSSEKILAEPLWEEHCQSSI